VRREHSDDVFGAGAGKCCVAACLPHAVDQTSDRNHEIPVGEVGVFADEDGQRVIGQAVDLSFKGRKKRGPTGVEIGERHAKLLQNDQNCRPTTAAGPTKPEAAMLRPRFGRHIITEAVASSQPW
jgi:hypothetical protein